MERRRCRPAVRASSRASAGSSRTGVGDARFCTQPTTPAGRLDGKAFPNINLGSEQGSPATERSNANLAQLVRANRLAAE
jgi:hypothetical protein